VLKIINLKFAREFTGISNSASAFLAKTALFLRVFLKIPKIAPLFKGPCHLRLQQQTAVLALGDPIKKPPLGGFLTAAKLLRFG